MKILVDKMPENVRLCPFHDVFYGAYKGEMHICRFCNEGGSTSAKHDCTGVENCRYFKAVDNTENWHWLEGGEN